MVLGKVLNTSSRRASSSASRHSSTCLRALLTTSPVFAPRLHVRLGLPMTSTTPCASPLTRKLTTMVEKITGTSGRQYEITKTLQDKERELGRVYLATDGDADFVLKEIPETFDKRADIYRRIGSHPHIRTPLDTVPARRMFVFEYLNEDLFDLARQNVPLAVTKKILKCALEGLAALHDLDLVHNDIKANNVMVQTAKHGSEIEVEKVQLIDLEETGYLPPGTAFMGGPLGNWMWRSPEAHSWGPIQKPSDMFSFGIVCIFAVLQRVVLQVDKSKYSDEGEKLALVVERQMSLFADPEGLDGLLRYIGEESDWHEIFLGIKSGFSEQNPRRPFALWKGFEGKLDQDFKDLIGGLTSFDPEERLTARQALAHKWFEGV